MKSMALSLLVLLLPSLSFAQTWTSCNPLNSTCPANPALGIRNAISNFQTAQARPDVWNTTAGALTYGTDGAEFTIMKKGDAPTIQSNFYILGGEVEVWMKAAEGKGVVSSIVLQSDDLDEIDLEVIGSNTTHIENNYYGKGNTTDAVSRSKYYPLSNPPQAGFHNYTTRWTKDALDWYVDGAIVRTLKYEDANGGASYPQSPMNVRIGVWAAGDKANDNYTVEWAGGEIDYEGGPYTMVVQSVRVNDYSTGKEYSYGDHSGSWESIKIEPGNSTIAHILSQPPPKTLKERWQGLSPTAKVAIYASVGAFVAIVLGLWALCCIKFRRAGKKEGMEAQKALEKDTQELMAYRARGKAGFRSHIDEMGSRERL